MHQGGLLQDGADQLYESHLGGHKDGFIATGIVEIEDEDGSSDRTGQHSSYWELEQPSER